jgi:hypothetical protein
VIENKGKSIDEFFGLDVMLAEYNAKLTKDKTQDDGFAKFHRTELGYEKGRPVGYFRCVMLPSTAYLLFIDVGEYRWTFPYSAL